MINFNNSVTNVFQTPGINADTFANRPAATVVPIGTIYIATNTGNMYRSDGEIWVSIGGGSGTIPGIDTVLAQNEYLTSQRFINIDGYSFIIDDNLTGQNLMTIYGDYQTFGGTDAYISLQGAGAPFIKTYTGANQKGFFLDFNNDNYIFGTETYLLQVDPNSEYIQTFTNSNKFGYKLLKDEAYFGDYDGFNLAFAVNVPSNELFTYVGGLYSGLSFIPGVYRIGDFDGAQNGTALLIDDNNEIVTLNTQNIILNGSTLESISAGGNSGKHLVIKLNGSTYKISLLNP